MYARLEDNVVMETMPEPVPGTTGWVTCPENTPHGSVYDPSKKTFKPRVIEEIVPQPLIPEAYRGLGFSPEDIEACENGTKTIDQVKAEMAASQ
jgi:hypothetical protein